MNARWIGTGSVGAPRIAVAGAVVLLVLSSSCLRSQAPASEEEKRQRIAELYERSRRSFPEVEGVSVGELEELRRGERPVVLVDVRTEEERRVSMIPGAIAAEEFERDAARYREALVVTYCTIGHRSGLYARDLVRQGREALNLEGSILSWTHAGGPLVDASGPTRRVHVYGGRWDLVAAGYEAEW